MPERPGPSAAEQLEQPRTFSADALVYLTDAYFRERSERDRPPEETAEEQLILVCAGYREEVANASYPQQTVGELIAALQARKDLSPTERQERKLFLEMLDEAYLVPEEAHERIKVERQKQLEGEGSALEADGQPQPEASAGEPASPYDKAEVVDAARNDVERLIASDLVNDVIELYNDRLSVRTDTLGGTGFQKRGAQHADLDSIWHKLSLSRLPSTQRETDVTKLPVEAVAFVPITETVYEERVIPGRKKLFGSEPDQQIKVPVGERAAKVENILTGALEPVVSVEYTFNPRGQAGRLPGMPEYNEVGGVRPGNYVELRVDLPESVAAALKKAIEDDPTVARELLEKAVLANADGSRMNEDVWNNPQRGGGRAKPPYEQLPEGWKLHIIEPAKPGDAPIERASNIPAHANYKMSAIPFRAKLAA